MAEISQGEWERFLTYHPDAHILQTSAWGQLKVEFGWQVATVVVQDCGAQILIKQILPGILFAYLPKGPVGLGYDKLWPEIDKLCRRNRCVFIKSRA